MYKNIQPSNLYYPVSHTNYVQHIFTSLIKDTNMYLHVELTINSLPLLSLTIIIMINYGKQKKLTPLKISNICILCSRYMESNCQAS